MASLLDGYKDIPPAPPADPAPPPAAPPADPPPAAPPPADDPAPPPAKPASSKARKAILPEDGEPTPSHRQPPEEPPPAAPPATPAPDADAAFIETLSEDQRTELEEAEFAAKLNPNKYKSLKKDLLAFYRRSEELIAKVSRGEEEEEAFKRILETKPKMELVDQRRVLRAMGAEEGAKKAKEALVPEVEEIKRNQAEMKIAPKLDAVANNFGNAVSEAFAVDEKSPVNNLVKLAKEKGFAEAAKEYPLEAEVAVDEMKRGKSLASEYVRIRWLARNGFYVYDEKNQTHSELIKLIADEANAFAQHGGDYRIKNGKRFVPRSEFQQKLKTERQISEFETENHWTFSDEDVLGVIAETTKSKIESRIKSEIEAAARRGFTRQPAQPKPANSKESGKAPPPQPITPPGGPSVAKPAVDAGKPAVDATGIAVAALYH